MSKELYGDGARRLQDVFDTRRLADRLEERLVKDHVGESDAAFIASLDMFFLATVDAQGNPNCSYKGGEPGFVRVLDPKTIAFPLLDGNGMFLSAGAIAEAGKVGMLFVDFAGQSRLRVNGVARVDRDDPLLPTFPEAKLVVRVAVTHVFPNCPRYIHRLALVERSKFVPKPEAATPVPSWKRTEWAADVLAADDPARAGDKEVCPR